MKTGTNENIFGCHDCQADVYDDRIYKDIKKGNNYIREKYFEVHKEVLRMAELKAGETILDIGIGTGLLEEKIKEKVKIYGIDISGKMMEKVNEKKINIVELKKGSFVNIPYTVKKFDIIVSCFAFHHLTDIEKDKSVFEMKRVLKENGRVVIGDFMYLNENSKKQLLEKFKTENRKDMIEEMKDENFTEVKNFKIRLEENGFEVKYKQVSTISWVIKASVSKTFN